MSTNQFVKPDGKTKIEWDGKKRTVKRTVEFEGTYTGTLMAVKGWEPRWFMVGKTAFLKSKVDGRFFPYTHAPAVAPGFFMA